MSRSKRSLRRASAARVRQCDGTRALEITRKGERVFREVFDVRDLW